MDACTDAEDHSGAAQHNRRSSYATQQQAPPMAPPRLLDQRLG
jgi:hypothetical protein